MAKTFEQVIGEMAGLVTTNLGSQDTRTGTVLREAFLAPVADQLVQAYSRTDQVEANQTISAPDAISTAAMDALAANFGLARFVGTASSGVVRFSRFATPAAPIVIPAGTVVSPSGIGDSLRFATLGVATLSALSEQDPVTGEYYIDAAAVCLVSGLAGNVDAETITYHSVPGVDSVTNPNQFSGGKDTQTNAELAQLIIAQSQGNLGTRSGYEALVRSNFSVDDMQIITPTDPEASRAQYGGEVDVTVLSTTYISSEETAAISTTTFYPTFLPLLSVTEIIGLNTLSADVTLVPGTDYDVIIDTYSPLSRSLDEKSRINFHVTSFSVKPASVFTIRYKNSEIIRVIQSFLLDPRNEILGANVMVKLAIEIGVNVTADIRIIPGYDPTTVQAAVVSALQTNLNAKLLDADVQVSDMVTVIGSVAGVDSVDLTTFKMARSSAPATYLQEILANKQEYVRPGIMTVTVVG